MPHFSIRRWGLPTMVIILVLLVAAVPVGAAPRSASPASSASGIWKRAGSLHDGRYYHTATLLPDGRVLVAGGCSLTSGICTPLSSAEVYFP